MFIADASIELVVVSVIVVPSWKRAHRDHLVGDPRMNCQAESSIPQTVQSGISHSYPSVVLK
jgi:hypothetical protein